MVDFNANVTIGWRDGEEINERVKRFTISTLAEWLQADYYLVLSDQDPDLIEELERVGFTRDMSGRPNYFVYTPQGGQRGDDHNLAALTTWVHGWWINNFSLEKHEKHGSYKDLAKPKWNYNNSGDTYGSRT